MKAELERKPQTIRSGVLNSVKLGVFCILLFGYSLTAQRLHAFAFGYLLLTLLAVGAAALLLLRLKDARPANMASWLVFAVFCVVYYLRFYWIVLDPRPVEQMLPLLAWDSFSFDTALFRGYLLTTLAFCAFAVTTYFGLSTEGYRRDSDSACLSPWVTTSYRRCSKLLLLLAPLLMAGSGYLTYRFKIALLGVAMDGHLPYRLAGLVYYTRTIGIPGLILSQVWFAGRSGREFQARAGIVLLLLHGASDMVLRASRGALLTMVLLLVFFVLLGGFKPKARDKWLMAGAFGSAIVAAPLITAYRYMRISQQGMTAALTSAASSGHVGLSTFLSGLSFVFFRVPGVEMIVSIVGLGAKPLGDLALGVLNSPRGIAGYLTVEILRFPASLAHTNAPTLLGWSYLTGGTPLVMVSGMVLGLIVTALWNLMSRLGARSGPVLNAFGLLIIFMALTEGTVENIRLYLLVALATVALIEFLVRLSELQLWIGSVKKRRIVNVGVN